MRCGCGSSFSGLCSSYLNTIILDINKGIKLKNSNINLDFCLFVIPYLPVKKPVQLLKVVLRKYVIIKNITNDIFIQIHNTSSPG